MLKSSYKHPIPSRCSYIRDLLTGKHWYQFFQCKHIVLPAAMGRCGQKLPVRSSKPGQPFHSAPQGQEGRTHTLALLAPHFLSHHKAEHFSPGWSSANEPSKQCENNRMILRKLFLSMSFDPSGQWIWTTWAGQGPGTLAAFVKLFAESEVWNSKKHCGSKGTACGTETAWIPPGLLWLHKYWLWINLLTIFCLSFFSFFFPFSSQVGAQSWFT